MDYGVFKFSSNDIHNFLGKDFVIDDIKKTTIHCILNPMPKALFIVMKLLR